jgi:hypothetical protein
MRGANVGRSVSCCPFETANFEIKDGRRVNLTNSGFGTVFGVVDGTIHPVCDYAALRHSDLGMDAVQVSN